MEKPGSRRALLLLPGGLALLAGLDGALVLLGVHAPVPAERLADAHGLLMVLGFAGTVVALERAAALRAPWGYASPALLGAGAVLAVGGPLGAARVAFLGGAVVLVVLYRAFWRRQPSPALAVQAAGAVVAVGAAALWAVDVPVPVLAPWLVGFLVLTVLGERMELGSAVRLSAGGAGRAAPWVALGCSLALVCAAAVALVAPAVGYRALGLALVACVVAVARLDGARYTVRGRGLPRYVAVAVLAGYAWLAVAAATWTVAGPQWSGRGYDAVLHAVFLGFVMSMIMAHAPVILPAVVRRPLPYTPWMYAPLALLHATLLVRLLVGDAWDVPAAVAAAGVGNVVATLAFVVVAGTSALRAGRRAPVRAARARAPHTEETVVGA